VVLLVGQVSNLTVDTRSGSKPDPCQQARRYAWTDQ